MRILLALLIALLLISPTAAVAGETPQEAVQHIIDLYKTRNFDKLIHERYSEIYKAEAHGKVDQLVERVSSRFSNEKKLSSVIELYEIILKVEPEIVTNPAPRETETEKMAEFNLNKDTFRLYLQKTGKWGFHM